MKPGRKFTGTLVAFGMILIGYVVTHYLKIDPDLFKTYTWSVITICFGYDGVNLVNKKIMNGGGK